MNMSTSITIRKTLRGSLSPKKIRQEEFIEMIEADPGFSWEESSNKLTATWHDEEMPGPLDFTLQHDGTIDIYFRGSKYDLIVLEKMIQLAGKLKAYVEDSEGTVFYDPVTGKRKAY
ncbi:hypothetical protein EV199_1770 [Pseudobacter ginsenosidimutans]|uniref:Uncharacterized protein n=2 Tax=Pseudobacter ginsenosidimutans TaxID=661488 RepID=A0A4Q7N4G3_9BACT|nr:hypothetical protein EV199_1770 [Pseudobacter ginsenosidimutans]